MKPDVSKGERKQKPSKWWRIPEIGNLELVRATYRTHIFPRHFHEEFAIGVITDGTKTMDYRGANYIFPKGTVCVINPGEVHTSQGFDEEGWMYRMIFPSEEFMRQVAAQVSGGKGKVPFFRSPLIEDFRLYKEFNRLHYMLENMPTFSMEEESHLLDTLAKLIIRHADCRPGDRTTQVYSKHIRLAKKYIDHHYEEKISLKELACMTDVSPYYLIRLFKKEVGLTPHVYLTHKRISLAKDLILKGHPIADVAFQTGFVDQNHLTNRFKTIVGLTPGQFLPANGIR